LALRELHASHIGEKRKAIGEIPACRCGFGRAEGDRGRRDPAPRSLSNMEK
jgi:hypothetical protein